jgi:hypothetical protein
MAATTPTASRRTMVCPVMLGRISSMGVSVISLA